MTGFAWTDDRVAELRQHFDANLTAGQIMQKMGGGLTRSAILGKLFRLGLRHDGLARAERTRQGIASAPRAPRTPRTRTAPFRAPPVIPAPKPKPSPAATAAPSGAHQCDIMGLTNETCRYPVTAEPPHLFCGDPTADVTHGEPYCEFHAGLAFRSVWHHSEATVDRARAFARKVRGIGDRGVDLANPLTFEAGVPSAADDNWTTLGAAARNVVAGLKG